jgi:hypothetical protein
MWRDPIQPTGVQDGRSRNRWVGTSLIFLNFIIIIKQVFLSLNINGYTAISYAAYKRRTETRVILIPIILFGLEAPRPRQNTEVGCFLQKRPYALISNPNVLAQ